MTHTHTHSRTLGPTCRKGWLIPHLTVVILQLRKMLLNEASLEHPLKKSSCLVSFKHPAEVASAERIQQQLFKLKIKLKSVQSQTNSCISINISTLKFEIETTSDPNISAQSIFFNIFYFLFCWDGFTCYFSQVGKAYCWRWCLSAGCLKNLKMWFRGSWCFPSRHLGLRWFFFPSYFVVVCVFFF